MIDLNDIKAGDEVQIANGDWFEVMLCNIQGLYIGDENMVR